MRPPPPPDPLASPPVIVLVDDSPEVGLIVQRLGRRSGYTVVHFPRAESAWEYLQQTRPDLVLLDVNLPGMSGLELCSLIREAPQLAGLPVALLSSALELADLQAEHKDGAALVLCKDLLARPEQWQARLQDILGRRGAAP